MSQMIQSTEIHSLTPYHFHSLDSNHTDLSMFPAASHLRAFDLLLLLSLKYLRINPNYSCSLTIGVSLASKIQNKLM